MGSIRTKPVIIIFKDNLYVETIEINVQKYRLDDGIGYQIWDVNNSNEKNKLYFLEKFRLTDEEYNLLQFEYFWFESLMVEINEDNSIIDYSIIKPTNLSKANRIKEILEKIYIIKRKEYIDNFEQLEKEVLNYKADIKNINLFNFLFNNRFKKLEAIEDLLKNIVRNNSNTYDDISFVNLIGILIGSLNSISEDYDIKIIICAG